MRSHEGGYPALLEISGEAVGALVLNENALAGDVWTADRSRRVIAETVIVGANLRRLYPAPPPPPPAADPAYDRQVRWFGDRGQALLGRLRVGVVGVGRVGQPLITMLARLGVGEIVVIDPDRVDAANLPRLPEARRSDAHLLLRTLSGGQRLAARVATSKIRPPAAVPAAPTAPPRSPASSPTSPNHAPLRSSPPAITSSSPPTPTSPECSSTPSPTNT